MMLLGIALLLCQRGHALTSVTTVRLGEPVTISCLFSDLDYSNTRIKWYKQSVGDSLTFIALLMKATGSITYADGFSSRFEANYTSDAGTLTILQTMAEDEAVYHCFVQTWRTEQWSGTYLSVTGNAQKSDVTVVQLPQVSDPLHPGDSVTLQCSVLSKPDTETCPGGHRVLWFRVGADKSYTNLIYTDGNKHDRCGKERGAHSPKSCVYHFSKNVSSLDEGTYYCAVASCGQVVIGEGTKLDITGADVSHSNSIFLLPLCVVLALSVIVIAFLLHALKKEKKCDHCSGKDAVSLQENILKVNFKRNADAWLYSHAVFTMMSRNGGRSSDSKRAERQRIYAAVKALGMD